VFPPTHPEVDDALRAVGVIPKKCLPVATEGVRACFFEKPDLLKGRVVATYFPK
jgi:hypothetical protein